MTTNTSRDDSKYHADGPGYAVRLKPLDASNQYNTEKFAIAIHPEFYVTQDVKETRDRAFESDNKDDNHITNGCVSVQGKTF